MSFFKDYLKDAQTASSACKVRVSVILAQWADETGYGGSYAFVTGNNYAGVSFSGVSSFPSKRAGLDAYISVLNHSDYDPVRAASGSANDQAVALGASPWAEAHYDAKGYLAGRRWPNLNPGIDLLSIIASNNLTQYDGAGSSSGGSSSGSTSAPLTSAGPQVQFPAAGFTSDVSLDRFIIDGTSADTLVSGALAVPQLDLSITQASTITLTLEDPDRALINLPAFNQKSMLNFNPLFFSLVSVQKQGDVLTVIFESYWVAALRSANGAITSAPGQMTRTDFAALLVSQIAGANFARAPLDYLYSLDQGYARPTQEQISRGTSNAPLEDSWTCLQRLADEIQWICFESYGTIYFGPYSWLAKQQPAMVPFEFLAGVGSIDGTYDVGQPLGDLTINCVADSWVPLPGQAVSVNQLGPFNGIWIVSEMARPNLLEPDITVTLMQPQPSLPEPTTGGAQAAVGAGFGDQGAQQSTGGSAAAKQALAYCVAQLGKPYVWGGENPATGFDCSGLMQAAYLSAGINITRTTISQWGPPPAAGQLVPAGIANLRPGDLVYFQGGDPPAPGHVAMVSSVDLGKNDVIVIDAFSTGYPIRYDHFGYVNPGGPTNFAGAYFGALRPAQ